MNMSRLGLALIVASSMVAPATARPPNILLVVNDDQGYGDASSFGSEDLKTPHFDSLAKDGARFTKFRVNPLCAPTRASLFTGLFSVETGMWRGPSQKAGNDRSFKSGIKLLPQYLKEAGYATGIFGKWHLGYESPDLPNDRGFDEFVGFLGGAHPYQARRGGRLLRNTQPLSTEKHLTDLFADSAEDFIRRNAARPFFCYVPFNAVHGPLRSDDRPADSGKPEWLAKYGHLEPRRRDYCAVLGHADARLGGLLALLQELKLAEDTLVICVSDNGGMIEKYPGDNGPLRGEKGTTYDGGIRVPAAMRWPGKIPPGTISDASAAHIDVFATAMEAAGIAVPSKNGPHAVSGVGLLKHLQSGAREPLPDRYLFWDLYGKMAAVHGDWKIVASSDNHHGKWEQAIKQVAETKFELYNLADDIAEQRNLADAKPEIYRDLKERYLAWFKTATRP
jgi:arylsulfatase A-like enzyme